MAVINMPQVFRLPPDLEDGYVDWPFRGYQYMLEAGLKPWFRVSVTFPVSLYGGFDVEAAKKGRFLLPNVGDIIIMRRIA